MHSGDESVGGTVKKKWHVSVGFGNVRVNEEVHGDRMSIDDSGTLRIWDKAAVIYAVSSHRGWIVREIPQ